MKLPILGRGHEQRTPVDALVSLAEHLDELRSGSTVRTGTLFERRPGFSGTSRRT